MNNAMTRPAVPQSRSNLSLVKVSSELIGDAQSLNTMYTELKDRTICLIPETANFSADRSKKLSLTAITVDTKMENNFGNQDIYKTDSGTYALHLTKLREIFLSAGGNVDDSRILERRVDQDGRVLFISHQIKGRIQSIDGTIKTATATGKYDFVRDCDRFQKNGQPNMNAVSQRRKHAEALAESNAMQRLIMSLVAKLKPSYTIQELQSKPIVVACVTEDKAGLLEMLPEAERNAIRTEYVRAKLGLGSAIYEGRQLPTESPKEAKELKAETVDVSLSDDEYEVIESERSHYEEDAPETLFGNDPKDIAEMYRDLTPDDRIERIMGLVESTGYVSPKGIPVNTDAVAALTVNQQISFVEKLLKLKNEQEAEL